MSRAFGYCRLSPRDQDITCQGCGELFTVREPQEQVYTCPKCRQEHDAFRLSGSIPDQARRISAYIRDRLEGVTEVRNLWEVESTHSAEFRERPRGREIMDEIHASDHFIVAKMDRGFRSVKDMLLTMEWMHRVGVNFHVIDLGIDVTTPAGKFVATVIAAMAEWERNIIGQRTREGIAMRARNGAIVNNTEPHGYIYVCSRCNHRYPQKGRTCPNCGVVRRDNIRVVPCLEEQQFMRQLLRWKDVEGFTWPHIERMVQERGAVNKHGRPYPLMTLRRLLDSAREMDKHGELWHEDNGMLL